MKKNIHLLFSVISLAFAGSVAQASEKPASLSLLFGNGFHDIYNLGAGLQFGKVTQEHIYLGVTGLYNFGTSESTTLGNQTIGVSANSMIGTGEVGYQITVEKFDITPYVGLGAAHFSASSNIPDFEESASKTRFALVPGLMGKYNLDETYFLGLNSRMNIVSHASAFSTYAMFGFNF